LMAPYETLMELEEEPVITIPSISKRG